MNIGDPVMLTEEPGSPHGLVIALERQALSNFILSISILLIDSVDNYAIVDCEGHVTYHTRH